MSAEPTQPLLRQAAFSTTYSRLPEAVAAVVGYDLQAVTYCMECGDRVGGGSVQNHARWHVGLPPKPKAKKDQQEAEAS